MRAKVPHPGRTNVYSARVITDAPLNEKNTRQNTRRRIELLSAMKIAISVQMDPSNLSLMW